MTEDGAAGADGGAAGADGGTGAADGGTGAAAGKPGPSMGTVLQHWTTAVCAELGLPDEVDRTLILDLARDAAHGVARPAAPLTTFLVGLAAGRAGGGSAEAQAAAIRVTELVRRWPGPPPA